MRDDDAEKRQGGYGNVYIEGEKANFRTFHFFRQFFFLFFLFLFPSMMLGGLVSPQILGSFVFVFFLFLQLLSYRYDMHTCADPLHTSLSFLMTVQLLHSFHAWFFLYCFSHLPSLAIN